MAIFGLFDRTPQARMGLDIGTRYIKLAVLNPTSQGLQLQHVGFAATPQGAVTDGMINNPEAVGEAIGQIIRYYNIRDRRVVCALPGRSVVIRIVNLPAGLSDREIKVATIGEVERFLPFPLDEMEYDYEAMGTVEAGDSRQTVVLFVASHRDVVQKRVEAARYGGLESVEMDVDPFVLMRSVLEAGLYDSPDTFKQTIMLVEMGASATSVSIIGGGALRFTRIFAVGGDTLTHAIESGIDSTFLEAEKLKRENAVAVVDESDLGVDARTREIHGHIHFHLENLALELRRSLAYYTSKYRGEVVNKILLTGGGSLLRGIKKFFEDELGLPVGYGNPLGNIAYTGDQDIELISARVPFLGVAVGLSLRQLPVKYTSRLSHQVNVEPDYEFGTAAQAVSIT
ncbi:MAG: type IV pilus assembly protein PilM [bacterium]